MNEQCHVCFTPISPKEGLVADEGLFFHRRCYGIFLHREARLARQIKIAEEEYHLGQEENFGDA